METASTQGSLGVTAVRLGVVPDGTRNLEERGTFARRPPCHPHIHHQPPPHLELTGTRLGSENSIGFQRCAVRFKSFKEKRETPILVTHFIFSI